MTSVRLATLPLWLMVAAGQVGASSPPPPVFDLCAERIDAIRIESADGAVTVHVRLTESAASELVKEADADMAVEVHAGDLSFVRFFVREPLQDQLPRRLESASGSLDHARALERAVERPCP
ncbi:MAG: hypothetical protein ACQER6_02170 [Pseudomonadota bacterium]